MCVASLARGPSRSSEECGYCSVLGRARGGKSDGVCLGRRKVDADKKIVRWALLWDRRGKRERAASRRYFVWCYGWDRVEVVGEAGNLVVTQPKQWSTEQRIPQPSLTLRVALDKIGFLVCYWAQTFEVSS